MTAITQNLPWFIKDLGVSIIGKECYTSLVEQLALGDVKCLKYAVSKGLGIGIVLGGSIMKVPQIILIIKARSARGLSLPAYILETLSYAITLAYSYRHNFPFSTYGENLFLTLQNILITLLIIFYAPPSLSSSPSSKRTQLTTAVALTLATSTLLTLLPPSLLSLLQLTTLPLSLSSKLPQISSIHSLRSTGTLSAFAVLSQILGCAARLFTTAQEVGDGIVAAGFALALVLNLVLGVQMWMYWGESGEGGDGFGLKASSSSSSSHSIYEEKKTDEKLYQPAAWESSPSSSASSTIHQPTASRYAASTPPPPINFGVGVGSGAGTGLSPHRTTSTPPPRTPSSAGGRKWARKVD